MAVSLQASKAGLASVDAARRTKGWSKTGEEWSRSADVTLASLKRFWLGERIKRDTFIKICDAVGIDWQKITDLPSVDTKDLSLQIDWEQIRQEMQPQLQPLTTNALMAQDGLGFDRSPFEPLPLRQRPNRPRLCPAGITVEVGSQLYEVAHEQGDVNQPEVSLSELVTSEILPSQPCRIALIGEPGSGKTSQLQAIAKHLLKKRGQRVIWVSLGNLGHKPLDDYLLNDWLATVTRSLSANPNQQEALVKEFNQGQVCLLLDGLEEMPTAESVNPVVKLASQLSGWVAAAPIVLTCRLNQWDEGKNPLTEFKVYQNIGLNHPTTLKGAIDQWFTARPDWGQKLCQALMLTSPNHADDGSPAIKTLQDVVKNPLRLAWLCWVWARWRGDRTLSDLQFGLYDQFADALYNWKQEHIGITLEERRDLEQFLGVLAIQARARQTTGAASPDVRIAGELVQKVFADRPALLKQALQIGWLNQVGWAEEDPLQPVYAFFHPSLAAFLEIKVILSTNYFQDAPAWKQLMFEVSWESTRWLWQQVPESTRRDLSQRLVQTLQTLVENFNPESTSDPIKRSTDDQCWQLIQAIEVLGIYEGRIIHILQALLDRKFSELTHCQAASSLLMINPNNQKAMETLRFFLVNEPAQPAVRHQALRSLERLQNHQSLSSSALSPLIATVEKVATHDPDQPTRLQANQILLLLDDQTDPQQQLRQVKDALSSVLPYEDDESEEEEEENPFSDEEPESSLNIARSVPFQILDMIETAQRYPRGTIERAKTVKQAQDTMRSALAVDQTAPRERARLIAELFSTANKIIDQPNLERQDLRNLLSLLQEYICQQAAEQPLAIDPALPPVTVRTISKRHQQGSLWKDLAEFYGQPISQLKTWDKLSSVTVFGMAIA